MSRIDNLTIKPRRIPKQKENKVAEYIITSCETCGNEVAMAAPFDGEPVLCADHDHDKPHFEVTEDVLAFEDDFALDCE